MSILVVCPGCLKRFQVSEKFAGKTGPCPHCKKTLTVPKLEEQVKIHAPEEFAAGGKDGEGRPTLKPLERRAEKWSLVSLSLTTALIVGVVVAAIILGRSMHLFQNGIIAAACLFLVSPFLSAGAYHFIADPELEPFRGKELYLRSLACGTVYVAFWIILSLIAPRFAAGEIWSWMIIAPVLFGGGSVAAAALYDVEPSVGFTHCAFYFVFTVLLRWIAGLGWVWEMGYKIKM